MSNGYEPGPVEKRVARRIGCKVSEVMNFLDVYGEEYLAFHKEVEEHADEYGEYGLTDDDANLAEHTERTLAETAPAMEAAQNDAKAPRARKSRAKGKEEV